LKGFSTVVKVCIPSPIQKFALTSALPIWTVFVSPVFGHYIGVKE
jgi:hypothetical protein